MGSETDQEPVVVERRERAAAVTLNRSAAMNSFTTEMAESFNEAMCDLSEESGGTGGGHHRR